MSPREQGISVFGQWSSISSDALRRLFRARLGARQGRERPASERRPSPVADTVRLASGLFLMGALFGVVLHLGMQALRTIVVPAAPPLTGLRRPRRRPARGAIPSVPAPEEPERDVRPVHHGPIAAFRYPSYVIFFVGAIFGVHGYFFYFTAQGWLALQLTSSAAGLSLLFTVSSFPTLILTFWGGALADRVNRRWLLLCTRLAVFVTIGSMGLASIAGVMTIPVFVALSLVLGVVWALDLPARQAMVADVVPPSVMANGYAWNSAIQFVGSTVGPIAAGFVVAAVGPGPALVAGAACHGLVALNMLFLRTTQRPSRSTEGSLRRVLNGLGFVRRNESVLLLWILACVPMVTVWGIQPLLPLVARDVLGGNAATYGYLTGAIGIGSIVGAVFVAVAHGVRAKGWLAVGGTLTGAVAIIAFAYTTTLMPALGFLLAYGAAVGVAQTITSAMVQVLTPPEYQGRVASLYVTTWNLAPVGILTFGALAEARGVPFGIWASGVSMAAIVLLLAVVRPRLRQIRG